MEQILKYLKDRETQLTKEIEDGLRYDKERDTTCSNHVTAMLDLTEKEGGLSEIKKTITVVEMFFNVGNVKNSEILK